ncbi:Marine sediment metagenome DNA, contig: S01H1_S18100 OS=marine sediment metagenome GN=S01H1_50976 PE=4 SV=1 [Gemmataceae bacterium]|nr:Marine sediment metagenome DNA, contig: S01H1_S18100 OS=marine sediment metagenome GN=S01H1_50976 PE=4 SV=1 [Gemmataceae bacterium]VTT98945.1 Marine sediment metagenome DNA, contig: S01H1_S18100 OS=marine sediment metagenome GN=S01H1_50976 PE=4 SV=1 [Gemmataceae bacterium]
MIAANKPDVILLNYSSAGDVTVEPQDEDRFVISAQKAVEACQQHQRGEHAIKAFKQKFLKPLRSWCESHASKVRACYVPPPAGGFLEVYVLGRTRKYDFDLGREVSKFELKLSDGGWRVSVMQIPECPDESLRTHFNPDGAIEVYAQPKSAPDEGKE